MSAKALLLFLLLASIYFAGCVSTEETRPLPTQTTQPSRTRPSPSPTPVAIARAAVTGTPEATNPARTPRPTGAAGPACSTTPLEFDASDVDPIMGVTHLNFLGEDEVFVGGWVDRPESISPTITPSPTSDPPATAVFDPHWNARTAWQAVKFNVAEEEVTPLAQSFDPLFRNPCDEPCYLEIFGESPDRRWQLARVWDTGRETKGVWLVGAASSLQLVNALPPVVEWRWSADSSLLWYLHTLIEVGVNGNVVRLTSPPTLTQVDVDSALDPTNHIVAVSPHDKTALAVPSPRGLMYGSAYSSALEENQLAIFDLTQEPPRQTGLQTVPGIASVVWNEATASYLLLIIQDEMVTIRERDGSLSVRIPVSYFQELYAREDVLERLAYQKFALSPSGRYFALNSGGSGILVFDCAATMQP